MKVILAINFFFKCTSLVIKNLSVFFLFLMTLLVFVQVVARYILGDTFTFIEEWVRWSQIWVVYLMGSVLVYESLAHINVDFIYQRLGNHWKSVVDFVSIILMIIIGYYFINGGSKLVNHYIRTGISTGTEIDVAMWMPNLILPIFGFLLILFSIGKALNLLFPSSQKAGE